MTLTQPTAVYLKDGDCHIEANVSLADYTSYRVGGPAQWFIAPHTLEQLQASVAWATQEGLPIMALGAGSNLLISDRGLPGLIIVTRHLREQTFDEASGQITVAAGKPIPRLCGQLAKKGWAGFEWAVGIPGTIGGAVVMNAGAHGGDISESLVNTLVLRNGSLQTLSNADLQYGYRSSALQNSQQIVLQATFALQPGHPPDTIQKLTDSHINHRLTTQPYDLPSCGSVFRNPLPQKAGQLIEQSGLKGFQIGGAQVSPKHANFIVNCGGATASDIHTLIFEIQHRIASQWDINLHPEVKILGDFDLET